MKKRITKPTFVEVMLAFRPADELLLQLRTGFVDCLKNGEPIIHDKTDDDLYILAPALRGWVDAMERIMKHHRLNMDLGPMSRLASKLEAGMPINSQHIEQCQAVVNRCRAAYKNMDIFVVKELVKTQMIAFEVDRLKLNGDENG